MRTNSMKVCYVTLNTDKEKDVSSWEVLEGAQSCGSVQPPSPRLSGCREVSSTSGAQRYTHNISSVRVESRDTRVDAAVGDHGIRPLYMDVQATTALVGHCMDLAAVLYSECVHCRTPGYWTPCYLTSPLSMGTLTLGHTPMAGRQRRQWRKGEK